MVRRLFLRRNAQTPIIRIEGRLHHAFSKLPLAWSVHYPRKGVRRQQLWPNPTQRVRMNATGLDATAADKVPSRICARLTFSDDPLRRLIIPGQTPRSSSDTRTVYFLFMRHLVPGNVPKTSDFTNPSI